MTLNSLGLPGRLRWWRVCLQFERLRFDPWVGKILWRRKWQSTPIFLPGKSHGRRSLAGYSSWEHKESDMTEQHHFQFLNSLVWWASQILSVACWCFKLCLFYLYSTSRWSKPFWWKKNFLLSKAKQNTELREMIVWSASLLLIHILCQLMGIS